MDWERVKELFHQALSDPSVLNDLDDDMRAEVASLLRAHEVAPAAPVEEGPGAVIGRYKLLQEIGEGGFGVVYMAEQTEPVKRKIALKIIKLGMDTKQGIARFEAERQALALMDHPNKRDYASAEAICREVLAAQRSDSALAILGSCLLEQNKHADAEPVLRECLAIRAKRMPGAWAHYNAMSMLGGALAGQGKYAEAEPLLLEGYEKMQPPPPAAVRKREARERVVQLYEKWGKLDKAARWRATRRPN